MTQVSDVAPGPLVLIVMAILLKFKAKGGSRNCFKAEGAKILKFERVLFEWIIVSQYN
jgi:hypothetical protein